MRRILLLAIALVLTGCTAAHPKPTAPQSSQPDSPPASQAQEPQPPAPGAGQQLASNMMRIVPADGLHLTAIHFDDAQHGWASGAGIHLITADGGRTWTQSPQAQAPASATPTAAPTQCAAGSDTRWTTAGAAIRKSTDGGQSWATVFTAPLEGDGWNGTIQCQGDSAWVLFAGGAAMSHQAYLVYRTADGGRSWKAELSSGWGVPEAVDKLGLPNIDAYSGPFDMVDAETAFFVGSCAPCFAVGTSSITRTTDGGKTWLHDDIAFERKVTDISFISATRGWILADHPDGSIILATADGGKTWTPRYPAGALAPARSVTMVSPTTGYGLGLPGNAGAILRTEDGGTIWSPIAQLPVDAARQPAGPFTPALAFPDETHGWAVNNGGRLLRTADAGAHWQETALPPGIKAVSGVAFATSGSGCIEAGGKGGTPALYRTTDGGATWQPVPAADGASGAMACAWQAAGQTWVVTPPQGMAGTWTVLAVQGKETAWAAADRGDLYATRDAGRSWQHYLWPKHAFEYQVATLSFGDETHGWATTIGGRALRTADGGATWQPVR